MRFLLALASSGILLTAPLLSTAQPRAASTVTPSSVFPSTYPADHAGVFVQTPDWAEIAGVAPSRTKAKHGIAASLSYGVVPATVVAEYEGAHASIQMKSGQPFFCLCHLLSLPGDRVIVRLHQKKNFRELDGGKMIVYPVVGGSKQADANQSDLTAVSISHPDPHVWLVRPQSELPAGEYALMLGTQNMSIFPFTVTVGSSDPSPEESKDSRQLVNPIGGPQTALYYRTVFPTLTH